MRDKHYSVCHKPDHNGGNDGSRGRSRSPKSFLHGRKYIMSIFTKIGSFVSDIIPAPAAHLSYQAKPSLPSLTGVPAQYAPTVQQASIHTGIPAQQLADQFNAENGGNWNPALKGRRDPTDFGITQLNPVAIKTITGKSPGGVNFFKNNYGHDFDPTNANDQILASGVYLNYLKSYALPEAGIKNPSTTDVMTSYNTGARGYANAQAGNTTAQARARRYTDLLTAHGATLQ